ncbi:hypothetical protein PBI_JOSHKAYV_47 [Mycobacterium phage JoshKayV]|uniref:Uncharacterized protein n=1 Tax=Mycobacterium phage JoshKayV TaxID=2024294 RepID=A0A249XTR7_9CAUD|nr:hypothetical protein KIY86_gp60 [Mycobacterium phage JoshKayV]ASZ75387.1 hypothetical protein PBI_JOSHKAYV_47 [Mycobacterium phage JoshKayV]
MSDRIEVIMAAPVDHALPGDVQGVNLRRKAIELMQEAGTVDENSVRYKGFSEEATVSIDGNNQMSLWQNNLRAFIFVADGKALPGILPGPEGRIFHHDPDTRFFSRVAVNRNPYEAA